MARERTSRHQPIRKESVFKTRWAILGELLSQRAERLHIRITW